MLRLGEMAPPNDATRATADRYFAEQCRRLGPIKAVQTRPARGISRALRTSFDRLSKRASKPT